MSKIIFLLSTLTIFGQVLSICHKANEIDETCGMTNQFFGNSKMQPLTTPEKFRENCGVMQGSYKCLKEYSEQCVTGMAQQVSKALLNNGHSHIDRLCSDADMQAEFIEHNQCFNDQGIWMQFHSCANRWFHMTEQTKNIPAELLFPAACCIYHEYQDCIREKNVALCHDKNAAYWEGVLDEVANEAVEMFCDNYKSKEDCAKNFPTDQWQKIIGPLEGMDEAALQSRPRFKSAFFTLVDQFSGHKI